MMYGMCISPHRVTGNEFSTGKGDIYYVACIFARRHTYTFSRGDKFL